MQREAIDASNDNVQAANLSSSLFAFCFESKLTA